jgi:hypothetical protein
MEGTSRFTDGATLNVNLRNNILEGMGLHQILEDLELFMQDNRGSSLKRIVCQPSQRWLIDKYCNLLASTATIFNLPSDGSLRFV